MSRLLLVRHGETAWNADRRLQGQLDITLSPLGRAQVAGVADTIRRHRPDRVVTSPLSRTTESVAVLGYTADLVDPRWQEADLGDWTGQDSTLLAAAGDGRYTRWRAGVFTPPGAESFEQMSARVGAALADLADAGGTTLVVTHGGPIRATCALLVGLEPGHLVPVNPGSLTVIDRPAGGRSALRSYNHTAQTVVGDPPD